MAIAQGGICDESLAKLNHKGNGTTNELKFTRIGGERRAIAALEMVVQKSQTVYHENMKMKCVSLICALSLLATLAQANDKPGPLAVTGDLLVIRPLCLAVTIFGAAVFVVALPVAAISKSVKPTADALVVKPAHATFTRQLGDLEALENEFEGSSD